MKKELIMFFGAVAASAAVAAGGDGEIASGGQLGASGYVLHHGEGEGEGEYGISLYSKVQSLPSYSLVVAPGQKSVRLLIVKDFGDRILFYTDTDGDGLVDEGMERDKAKKTLRKFKLRLVIEDK